MENINLVPAERKKNTNDSKYYNMLATQYAITKKEVKSNPKQPSCKKKFWGCTLFFTTGIRYL